MTSRTAIDPVSERIVDAALALADAEGWEAVRFHRIAERLDLPLGEIGGRFRDLDAIANAWFARARAAVLSTDPARLSHESADERLALVVERWLDALAPHREATGAMLRAKLYPSHPHHWVPLVFNLSRLVHDLLDAARIEGSGRLRQAQEIGMTLIVLATLRDWLRDADAGQAWSRDRLRRRLAMAGRCARWLAWAGRDRR